jgi:hypothetical protein
MTIDARTKRRTFLAAAAAALAIAVGAATDAARAGGGPECERPADERFVVHEWGTFTSMQGSTGIVLEGLTREEESLPSFVYDRTQIRDCPLRAKGWKGLEVPADHVTQKMETPVIYFHSAKERRVRVRVDFKKGLLTQWYPVSDLLGPAEGSRDGAPIDLSKIESSFLQWDVDVLPKGAERPTIVPSVAADDPWSFAREVDASWVRTLPRKEPDRAGPVEAERYLFYRGLGSFALPLRVTAEAGGKLTIRNEGDVAIPFVLPYEVRGNQVRLAAGGPVPVRGTIRADLSADDWGPLDNLSKKLEVWVDDLLRKHGLREDEARAMVRTWSRSWFKAEGARVLWIVPRATTDQLLPISIDPKPDELVRVLVGRAEVILPETEAEDIALLDGMGSDDDAVRQKARAQLERRGRFLEPHLRNVVAGLEPRLLAGKADLREEKALKQAMAWLNHLRAEAASEPGKETPFAR